MKIGTFNVHGWDDENYSSNHERVAMLARTQRLHALALQEVAESESAVEALAARGVLCGGKTRCTDLRPRHCGVDVFAGGMDSSAGPGSIELQSSVPASKRNFDKRAALVRCRVAHGGGSGGPAQRSCDVDTFRVPEHSSKMPTWTQVPLGIVNVHLNYRDEPRRMTEIREALRAVSKVRDSVPILVCGDFNALTPSDYDEKTLAEITDTRRKNRWELPQSDVTDLMRAGGWTDVWRHADREGRAVDKEPSSASRRGATCRYDTRIDYIFVNDAFLRLWDIDRCEVVRSDASDHSLLVATFSEKTVDGLGTAFSENCWE